VRCGADDTGDKQSRSPARRTEPIISTTVLVAVRAVQVINMQNSVASITVGAATAASIVLQVYRSYPQTVGCRIVVEGTKLG